MVSEFFSAVTQVYDAISIESSFGKPSRGREREIPMQKCPEEEAKNRTCGAIALGEMLRFYFAPRKTVKRTRSGIRTVCFDSRYQCMEISAINIHNSDVHI